MEKMIEEEFDLLATEKYANLSVKEVAELLENKVIS